jgi:hypothetical protein
MQRMIEEQLVNIDVEIQCTAGAMDQFDLTGVSSLLGVTRYTDRVRSKGTLSDTSGPSPQDGRSIREQRTLRKRELTTQVILYGSGFAFEQTL